MSRGDGVTRESEHVDLEGFMEGVKRRNPGQTEFVQAVQEVAEDIFEFIDGKEDYHRWQILRRIAEPDRVVSLPRLLGGRQPQYPRPARLSRPEQQCDRPL